MYRWPIGTASLITEMQIKTVQYSEVSPSHWSELPLLKSLQITNAGRNVEKGEPSYTVGENVNCCSHYGKQLEVP